MNLSRNTEVLSNKAKRGLTQNEQVLLFFAKITSYFMEKYLKEDFKMDKNALLGWAVIIGVATVSYKAGRKVGLADGEVVGFTKLFESISEACSKKIEE